MLLGNESQIGSNYIYELFQEVGGCNSRCVKSLKSGLSLASGQVSVWC